MKADQIIEVIDKLIGDIDPTGLLMTDRDREENLKIYLQVWDKMHTRIDNIAYYNESKSETSVKKIVKLCSEQLDRVGIKDD